MSVAVESVLYIQSYMIFVLLNVIYFFENAHEFFLLTGCIKCVQQLISQTSLTQGVLRLCRIFCFAHCVY